MDDAPTLPGMEIKVTPLSDAPIMPKLTTYHGDWRFPVKKVAFEVVLVVKRATPISRPK